MRVVVFRKINTKKRGKQCNICIAIIKSSRIREQSNKSELRTEENGEVVNHVRNYGTNLMRKIGMLKRKTIQQRQ